MKGTNAYRLFPDVDPATISILPVLDRFHEGVMITDAQGIVLYMNAAQTNIDDFIAADSDLLAAVSMKVMGQPGPGTCANWPTSDGWHMVCAKA